MGLSSLSYLLIAFLSLQEKKISLRVNQNILLEDVLAILAQKSGYNVTLQGKKTNSQGLYISYNSTDKILRDLSHFLGAEVVQNGKKLTIENKKKHWRQYNFSLTSQKCKYQDNEKLSTEEHSYKNSSFFSDEDDSDIWKEVENSLFDISGKNNVVIEKNSGYINIFASQDIHNMVKTYLHNTQTFLDRRLLIEAEIIQIERLNRDASSINWNELNIQNISHADIGSVIDKIKQFLCSDVIEIKKIASPFIRIQNNKRAFIKSVNYAHLKDEEKKDKSTFWTSNQNLEKPLGLTLVIKSAINKKNIIHTDLKVKFSSISDDQNTVVSVIDTHLASHPGENIIMGGLISKENTYFCHKTPILGDIPLLDIFFTDYKVANLSKELVIILKIKEVR